MFSYIVVSEQRSTLVKPNKMNTQENKESEAKMFKILNERIQLMLRDSKIMKKFQSFKTERKAKDWIMEQAMFTLLFSVEERKL